jgi:phosphatidylinositol glycan class F
MKEDQNANLCPTVTQIQPTFFSLILTLVLPPIPLTIIALVLGAPLYPTSLLPHKLLLSLHVSLLAFLPIFYTHGISSGAWRDVAAAWLPFDEAGVWAGTVGAMIGGWVGAVPIALDWDREWQKWPCTVVWGVVLGWTLGRLLTTVAGVGVGKRINLSEKEEESHHSRPEFVLAEKSREGK